MNKQIIKLIKRCGFIQKKLVNTITADYIFYCPISDTTYTSYTSGYVRYEKIVTQRYSWEKDIFKRMSPLNPYIKGKIVMLNETERLLKILSIALNKRNK